MNLLKKVLSAAMIFILVAPSLTTIAIYADDLTNATFTTEFDSSESTDSDAQNENDTFNNFKESSSDGSVTVTYDGRETDYEKEVKITLPEGLEFDFEPTIDGDIVVDYETTVEGVNNVMYVSIPAMDNGINNSFGFGVDIDADKFYSGESFEIQSEYYELDANGDKDTSKPVKTDSLYMTAYDYSANGKIESYVNSDTRIAFTDAENTFQLTLRYGGDYEELRGTYRNDDFTMYVSDYQIDMSKILVDKGSGDVPLGSNYQYISIEDTTEYTYDESTGILTFAPFEINPADTIIRVTYDFDMSFDSAYFNEGDRIDFNTPESTTANYSENNLNDVGSSVHSGIQYNKDVEIEKSGYYIDVQVWAQSNDTNVHGEEHTLKPDVESPLFKTYVTNYNNDITDLEYTINVPDGMTVDSVSAPEVLPTSADYGGTVTITDSSSNQTVINEGETKDLAQSVVGPDTITVTVDSMDATDVIYFLTNSNNRAKYGISFYGSVTGDEGDVQNVSLDDSTITADVDGLTDQTFIDDDTSNNDLDVTIQYLQTPSIRTRIYEFSKDGTVTSGAQPNEAVQIKTEYGISESSDISVYKKLHDPVIYMNIPAELNPPGGTWDINDIELTLEDGEDGSITDINSEITSFTATDSPIISGGTMLEIKLDGYTLSYPDIITLRTNTVVDSTISDTTTMVLPDGATAFGTTNTDEIQGIHSSTEVAIDESTLGVDVTGDILSGIEAGDQFTINIPATIRAVSSVDTTGNGFVSVNSATDLSDYPEYYMGEEGVFNFTLQNTTTDDIQGLTGYYVLPHDDYEGMQFVLDDTSVVYDNTNFTYEFTNDEISDTTGWQTGDESNVTWSSTFPADGEITAIKIVANDLASGDTYNLQIPYTTKYLTEDQYDQDRYDKKTDGELVYVYGQNNSPDGYRASITIEESEYPEITTNIDSVYSYDETDDLITDVQNYTVTDDYSELTDDINKEETTITVTEPNQNVITYTYNEFINLTAAPAGDYTIHYKTENDADGHVTLKDIDFKVEQDTDIVKTVADENGNGVAEDGEDLIYTVSLKNNTASEATNIPIRDSLLEDLPDYIDYNDDISLSSGTYTGDITNGTFVVDSIGAGETILITYSVAIDLIPDDVTEITNIVTDSGDEPGTTCEEGVDEDCSSAVIPTNPETTINKTALDENANGIAEVNETIFYTITVENSSSTDTAVNVPVRDSLIEGLPVYLQYNTDLNITNGSVSGHISNGSLTIDSIAPGDSVVISYSVTVKSIPSDITEITNIVTDNGEDPDVACVDGDDDDCSSTTTPTNPLTNIDKSVSDENGNGVAEDGEVLTYTVSVENSSTDKDVINVHVRDSLLENVPQGLTYNNDLSVSAGTYSGDISSGTLVIDSIGAGETLIITYSITVDDAKQFDEIKNIVTDNGLNPETTCSVENDDCASTTTPTNPSTTIKKSVSDENANGVAEEGEVITYSISVSNENANSDVFDVAVRDSMLEDLPTYITYNNDLVLSSGTYTGDISAGTFAIDTIPQGDVVTITYSITLDSIEEGIDQLENIVTDNGEDPDTTCVEGDEDCSSAVIPTNPETTIAKAVEDENNNNIAELNETLVYTVTVTNTSTESATFDVPVRDSLLENLPDYLTYNNDLSISSGTVSGHITNGSLVIDSIAAGDYVILTYSVTVNDLPEDNSDITNIVTDNGENPDITCVEGDDDCSSTTTPTNPKTTIEKSVSDENGNDVAEAGEVLTYSIEVENSSTDKDVINVKVRDSLLEKLPTNLTYNGDLSLSAGTYTGDISAGTFVIDEIGAGESVTITYSITVNSVDGLGTDIINIVTDNGLNPETTCGKDDEDCSSTTTPTNPATTILKTASDENNNDIAEIGEVITYSVDVTNSSSDDVAYNVAVRDSLLEDIPTNIVYNNDLSLSEGTYIGDITTGTFVIESIGAGETVTITYTITVNDVDGITEITNIVTDNGEEPDPTCEVGVDPDCSSTTTPTNPATTIDKSVVDENGNGVAEIDEVITYSIEVTNTSSDKEAINIPVRDTMLENMDSNLSYNEDLTLSSGTFSGDVTNGTLTIDSIAAGESVILTYSITVDALPEDGSDLVNIVTDNGEEPDPTCEVGVDPDCSSTTTPTNPSTTIDKSVVDENGNGVAEEGETVYYTIDITNTSIDKEALNIPVRDSMLENLPANVTYNEDMSLSTGTFSGDVTDGTLTIDSIASGATVTITYSIVLDSITSETEDLENIVTDDGDNPDTTCEVGVDPDCSATVIPTNPETLIAKTAADENGNGVAEEGETVYYNIDVTNTSSEDAAVNISVRDSMLEDLPTYVTYNYDLTLSTGTYTGDITTGSLEIYSIGAGETVTLTYSVVVDSIPEDVDSLINIVTDNGEEPETICEDGDEDCSGTTTPFEPGTTIDKSVIDEDGSNSGEKGETLTYTVEVKNFDSENSAYDIAIRDSILENLPSYLQYNDDLSINGANYSGDITEGTFIIDEIKANETATITYTITILEVPEDVDSVLNIVTNSGNEPEEVCSVTDDECSSAEIELTPDKSGETSTGSPDGSTDETGEISTTGFYYSITAIASMLVVILSLVLVKRVRR